MTNSNAATPLLPRSPRYTLTDNDDCQLLLKGASKEAEVFQVKLLDVSSSGIGILADQLSTPFVGEKIKFEFTVPGGESIAWWGKVVRLQPYTPSDRQSDQISYLKVIVGIQFEPMPLNHRSNLRLAIKSKLADLYNKSRSEQDSLEPLTVSNQKHASWKLLTYALTCFFCMLIIFWAVNLPAEQWVEQFYITAYHVLTERFS